MKNAEGFGTLFPATTAWFVYNVAHLPLKYCFLVTTANEQLQWTKVNPRSRDKILDEMAKLPDIRLRQRNIMP
jgi:hypothetical protein